MDRFINLEEEDITNTSNNDHNAHGRLRNLTKRKFHCRIPVPTRSSSSSSASTAQEEQKSDVVSSCSGQPLPITIKIKLCASRSTSSNPLQVKYVQNKTTRRTMAPLNDVEQQEFETWRHNRVHALHSDHRLETKVPKTVDASTMPPTTQSCQSSAGAPQFQQNTRQYYCRCQPYDSGIVLYAVCGNSCRRMETQNVPTPTNTNIYVDVIPTGSETVRDEIPLRSRSVSKDKSFIAISRNTQQLCNENIKDPAPGPTEIANTSKSVYKFPAKRGSSVERNATDETYTIQGSRKLPEHSTTESNCSSEANSQNRNEYRDRSKSRSKNESLVSSAVSKNDHPNCTLEELPKRSGNNKKASTTEMSKMKRSKNLYGQAPGQNNRISSHDNNKTNYSDASDAFPKINLLNGSQCHESSYHEASGVRSNNQVSPYKYSVEVRNEARNRTATVIPSILPKNCQYDDTPIGRNLKTQYKQPLTSDGLRFLPDNQEAGICTCEKKPERSVRSKSYAEEMVNVPEQEKPNKGNTSCGSNYSNQYSFRILPEDQASDSPPEIVNVVAEERTKLFKAPNSLVPNPANTISIIETTIPVLPSIETAHIKPPDDFRIRGGQDAELSFQKCTPPESKAQTTSKMSMFTIKPREDDFSVKFHASNEETECPLKESTDNYPEIVRNKKVSAKKADKKAGRSSVSFCRMKEHVNCACSLPAINSSSANSSSPSSDADDVQWGPPCSGESPDHSDHNSNCSCLATGNLSKYPKPFEDFKGSINSKTSREGMDVDNDTTDRPITPCPNQRNISHTNSNKLYRPRSCSKYRSEGRPETCKCYKPSNKDEFLAKTIKNIYACRSDRRPKQFIYDRVTNADRKPTAILRSSKTNPMRPSEDGAKLPLNFRQICIYLKTARLERRAELLQAIRWRLTQESSDVQLKTITDICDYDLFKLRCRCGSRSLLEDLLWPLNTSVPNSLQESTARLLNAVVSTQVGRNYVGSVSVIETLVWGETIYATPFSYNDRDYVNVQMADQLIATMMKLSLNPAQRTDMIHKGLVRWLIRHMEDVEYSATAYHQENMIALMMMLVGHPGSRELVAEKCTQVLSLLIRYMQHPGEEPAHLFQRYVRLALIDLLHSARLVSCAKQINFPQIVCQMIKKCTDSVERKELETIAELLEKTNTSLLNSVPAYQVVFKENQIFREPNIDSDDPVAATAGEGGEELLTAKFGEQTASLQSTIFRKDSGRKKTTKIAIASSPTAFSEQNQSFSHVPHQNRIFGDVNLPVQQQKSLKKSRKSRSTTPHTFPVSLPDITNETYRSEMKTSLRRRSASPKRTTSKPSQDFSFKNTKSLTDHPSVTFAAEMVNPKSTKPYAQGLAQQTSATITAIATEQPRKIAQSIGQKKRKSVSKSEAVDLVQKPVTNTRHENRLETVSIKNSVMPRSAPETVQDNSSNSIKEVERAATLPRAQPSKKTKNYAKSSVDVLKKRDQNCENCGFAKIDYVVDRCTSTEQLNWRDDKRFLVLSETEEKSHDAKLIKPIISSENELLCPSECTVFRAGCCETCGRQVSADKLRYSKLEPNEIMAQLRLSNRTEQLENQQYSAQEDHKLKPLYYETESPAQCERLNDEKCNFDCSARTFFDKQYASCGRPNDRQMSAPLVSYKFSRLFDSAVLPYQRTAKSLDIDSYGKAMFGQFDTAERNRWNQEFIALPSESYSHFEEEQQVQYEPQGQNEELPQARSGSRIPVRVKCHTETSTQNCRRCSRRSTDPKPTYQGLPMAAQKTRSKSKSPHGERLS